MKNKIEYSCIVDTVFSLLLYLLYTNDEDGKKTFFCVGESVGLSVAGRLPNCFFLRSPRSRWSLIILRIKLMFKRVKICKTEKYAQDHIYGVMLIGHSKYSLLEDAMGSVCNIKDKTMSPFWRNYFGEKTLIKKLYGKLIYSHLYYDKVLGLNKQCKNRIVTTQESANSVFFSGRKCEIVDIFSLWNNSSEKKKKFILKVFNISDDLLVSMGKASVLILTSPFMEGGGVSEKDCYKILKPYYDKYENEGICIKTHPRDCQFPYEKYYPKSTVIRSRAPVQLFYMMNTKISTVVSESLSAVKGLPPTVRIDFVDLSTNKLLFERFGDLRKKHEMDNVNKTS